VTDFIYMGFPKRTFDSQVAYGFEGKRFKLSSSAYLCPRCGTRATDIPTSCCVCGLQLNSSSHIARSHHHLFPVPNFIEYDVKVVMVDPSHGQQTKEEVAPVSDKPDKLVLTIRKKPKPLIRTFQAVCVDPAQAALILQVSEGTEGAEGEGEERGLEAETLLGSRCRGCLKGVCEEGKMIMRCPRCWHFFCVECDLFMHDSLHNCPGCPSV